MGDFLSIFILLLLLEMRIVELVNCMHHNVLMAQVKGAQKTSLSY